jgi:hypothetical protein
MKSNGGECQGFAREREPEGLVALTPIQSKDAGGCGAKSATAGFAPHAKLLRSFPCAPQGAHCSKVRGFVCSSRATARIHRGAPAGADGRARPTERESVRRKAAEAARMGRARSGRGVVLPWVRAKRKLKNWADAKREPTRNAARARRAKLAVPQPSRGARHNNTSQTATTKRSAARATGRRLGRRCYVQWRQPFTPRRLPRLRPARCRPSLAQLTSPTQPRRLKSNVVWRGACPLTAPQLTASAVTDGAR